MFFYWEKIAGERYTDLHGSSESLADMQGYYLSTLKRISLKSCHSENELATSPISFSLTLTNVKQVW